MTTVRQLERLWNAKSYARMKGELLCSRQEACFGIEGLERPCALAALALIRLDELCQSHHPLYERFVRVLLASRDRDGGWGDPAITALCLRALMLGNGDGDAIDAALAVLAALQKENGIWPAGPIRRLPDDPAASLFILFQLGSNARFQSAVRFDDALSWFDGNRSRLTAQHRALYDRTRLRWRRVVEEASAPSLFCMS